MSLLLTCRVIHDEAYGIFYSQNCLHLDLHRGEWIGHYDAPQSAISSFGFLIETVGGRRLDAFRDVSLSFDEAEQCTALLKALACFTGLEVARIRMVDPCMFLNRHLKNLCRERHFLGLACAELPTTLQHVHFTIKQEDNARRLMSKEEKQEYREQLVKSLWKPLQDGSETVSTVQQERCPCLWCDTDLKVRVRQRRAASTAQKRGRRLD